MEWRKYEERWKDDGVRRNGPICRQQVFIKNKTELSGRRVK